MCFLSQRLWPPMLSNSKKAFSSSLKSATKFAKKEGATSKIVKSLNAPGVRATL